MNYLYEKEKNKVNVYTMQPKEDAVREYRYDRANEIVVFDFKSDFNEVDAFCTGDKIIELEPDETEKFTCLESLLFPGETKRRYLEGEYINLKCVLNKINSNIIVGYNNILKVARMGEPRTVQLNILVTTAPKNSIIRCPEYNYKAMITKNVISLPNELAVVQMLQTYDLEKLLKNKMSFEEQLALFSIEQVDSIGFENLSKIVSYGLGEAKTFSQMENKITLTEQIVEKAKTLNLIR